MPDNYDSTNGLPFDCITKMDFTFSPSTGQPTLCFTSQKSLKDASGDLHPLSDFPCQVGTVQVDLTDLNPIQIYDPNTGNPLPGETMTYEQIFAAVYSVAQVWRLAQGS